MPSLTVPQQHLLPPWLGQPPVESGFPFTATANPPFQFPFGGFPNTQSASIPAAAPPPGLEATLQQRSELVENTLRTSTPQATVQLISPEIHAPEQNLPLLADFQNLAGRRHQQLQSRALSGQARPSQQPWEALTQAPGYLTTGLGSPPTNPAQMQALPTDFTQFADTMRQYQVQLSQRIEERRAQRQQRLQHRLLAHRHDIALSSAAGAFLPDDRPETPPQPRRDQMECTICQDIVLRGEMIAVLVCQHSFHLSCVDTWTAQQTQDRLPVVCPHCRAQIYVQASQEYLGPQETSINSPRSELLLATPESAQITYQSVISAGNIQDAAEAWENQDARFLAPWWPAPPESTGHCPPFYHATTQLPNGQLSMIVDPGAWTNLWGKVVARALTKRALDNGHDPEQTKMRQPLAIQGVGNGSQQCQWQLTCPIAAPHADGQSHLHKITAPIVEGSGENLPGLLGLRSLEELRGIMDCGNRKLYFPGPGEVQIILPPGSVEIPLHKAPSGHLVMIIDDFEHLASRKGGTPDASLQLHTSSSSSAAAPTPAPPAAAASIHGQADGWHFRV